MIKFITANQAGLRLVDHKLLISYAAWATLKTMQQVTALAYQCSTRDAHISATLLLRSPLCTGTEKLKFIGCTPLRKVEHTSLVVDDRELQRNMRRSDNQRALVLLCENFFYDESSCKCNGRHKRHHSAGSVTWRPVESARGPKYFFAKQRLASNTPAGVLQRL